jgi:NADPH-dependent ferric siderophore reductase
MPKLPSWLANTMEKVISNKIYQVEVVETKMLSSNLKCVTFKGDFFDAKFIPGNEVLFRVNANEYRHYTLSGFDEANETCEVIFYLNKQGPGYSLAVNIQKGDHLRLIVDRGKVKYNEEANQHFFFGDETSLGLYESLGKKVMEEDVEYFGVLELQEENLSSVDQLKLLIDTVPADVNAPAKNAINWMENMHPICWEMWQNATFYLTGRAKSVQEFKKYLKQRGVSFKQIITMSYWEIGKVGGG